MRVIRLLLGLLLLPSLAAAQTTIDTPKVTGWAVLENTVEEAAKLTGWAVLFGVNIGANGGGGGGAAGIFGNGENGGPASFLAVGYGGAGDDNNTARQNTAGATGNAGVEWGTSGIGSGSGGAGGSWNGTGTGQAGGVGGTYGGGGGGGGGGSSGGGGGALGGEGVIWLSYGATNIILDKDSGPTWTVPMDWSNTNTVLLLGPGGCGSAGSTTRGGNGGWGGNAVGGTNVISFTPGQVVSIEIISAADACAGVPGHTKLNGYQAGGGPNGDGTGGDDNIPIPPTDIGPGGGVINWIPGTGGNGGVLNPPPVSTGQFLQRAPFTHWW